MEDEVGARARPDRLGGALEAAHGLREAVAQKDDVDEEAKPLDLTHHDRGREQRGRHCKRVRMSQMLQNLPICTLGSPYFILKGCVNPTKRRGKARNLALP